MGVVESELETSGGDGLRLDGEGVGSDHVEGETLHGWVRDKVPRATAGAMAKLLGNW